LRRSGTGIEKKAAYSEIKDSAAPTSQLS